MAVKKTKPEWEMELGCKGLNVKKAQEMLHKLGSTIKVTGEFTIGMMSAIRSFQKKNGLAPTGKMDKKTWDKLYALTHAVKRTTKKK